MPLKRWIVAIAVSLFLVAPPSHANTNMREFIMSCTYGVLAGTLVGAAMLAFTDQPGDHLSKVARGASIGLYAGILLGVYVVYGVDDKETEPDLMNGPSEGWQRPLQRTQWAIVPTLHQSRPDGAAWTGTILSF